MTLQLWTLWTWGHLAKVGPTVVASGKGCSTYANLRGQELFSVDFTVASCKHPNIPSNPNLILPYTANILLVIVHGVKSGSTIRARGQMREVHI